jgi:hypothetical protein
MYFRVCIYMGELGLFCFTTVGEGLFVNTRRLQRIRGQKRYAREDSLPALPAGHLSPPRFDV